VIAVANDRNPLRPPETSCAVVQKTGELGIAILNAGAVQLPEFDRAYLALSADHAADVAKVLGARTAIPLHFEGWAHVTQGAGELEAVLGQWDR